MLQDRSSSLSQLLRQVQAEDGVVVQGQWETYTRARTCWLQQFMRALQGYIHMSPESKVLACDSGFDMLCNEYNMV
jgi:hypothetical protein